MFEFTGQAGRDGQNGSVGATGQKGDTGIAGTPGTPGLTGSTGMFVEYCNKSWLRINLLYRIDNLILNLLTKSICSNLILWRCSITVFFNLNYIFFKL